MAKKSKVSAKFESRKVGSAAKPQKFLVIRSNGKIISAISQKNLRKQNLSKEKAIEQFKQTKSLNPQVINRSRFSNGFVQTISKKQFGTKQRSQIGADIQIRKRGKVTTLTGYSNLGETGKLGQQQAKRRALGKGVDLGLFNYKDMPRLMQSTTAKYFFINFNFVSEEREQSFVNA